MGADDPFEPTHLDDPYPFYAQLRARADDLNRRFYRKMKKAGALRGDVKVEDFSFIFEQLAAVHGGTPARTAQLRHRYLELVLQGLTATGSPTLPGPAPSPAEIAARWDV